ncbi:MAG: 50S ribosomal protein L25 [Candidatus Omnitrophota bacterium]
MDEIILGAKIRVETGRAKVNDLRDAGFIPAVVYAQGKSALCVKISKSELIKLIHQHRIESAIINLKLEDDKKSGMRPCLIKEIQYEPVHGDILHVDLNEVSLTEALKVNVPVVAKGEPIGVKQEGGQLEHILWEVEVECLPTDIPKEITVEVGALKIGDSIHVKDLTVPAGVKIITDSGAIVLSVSAPMKEEVPAEAVEGEVTQEPEVIKEKKEVPAEEGKEEEGKEPKKEKEK